MGLSATEVCDGYRPERITLLLIGEALPAGSTFYQEKSTLYFESRTVARTFTVGIGETLPKSGEARTVDLTPQAAAVSKVGSSKDTVTTMDSSSIGKSEGT